MATRDHKTSVRGTDYVLHLDRPGYPNHVWCGRKRVDVNRADLKDGDAVGTEEHCRMCIRCMRFGAAIEPREVTSGRTAR